MAVYMRKYRPPVHHRNSHAQFTACGQDTMDGHHEARCTTRKRKATCAVCVTVLQRRGLS